MHRLPQVTFVHRQFPTLVPDFLVAPYPGLRRPPRFFLSHYRGNAPVIAELQRVLQFRGLHAWRDTSDLELGETFETALRRAIRQEVSAFIALVTPEFLTRPIIWNLEVPEALDRQERDPSFLIIPIFSGVRPEELTATCAQHGLRDMSAFNGHFLPARTNGRNRAAVLRVVGQKTLRAGLRARVPADSSVVPRLLLRTQPGTSFEPSVDLDLDWTAPFAAGCPTSREWTGELLPALGDVRDALKALSVKEVFVEVQARLSAPVALGEAFSATSKLTLTFGGRNGAWSTGAARRESPVLVREDVQAPGVDRTVALVDVSIARDVAHAVAEHAMTIPDEAGLAVRFSPTNGPSQSAVEDDSWAITAAWEVGEHMRMMHDRLGVRHFHLFVAAPAEWCVLLGHTLNAVGDITIYQRHPTTGEYVAACRLGAVGAVQPLAAPSATP